MMMVVQNVFVHSVNAGCVENAGRSGSLARVAGIERKLSAWYVGACLKLSLVCR